MKTFLFINIFFLNLFSIAHAQSDIIIHEAWSPEAPPVAKVMAGYMTIHNTGNKTLKIVNSKSSLFKKVEIHKMDMKDGMMRMEKIDAMVLQPGKKVNLEPGGLHMMFIKPVKWVSAGNEIPVTLSFDNNTSLTFKIKVIKNRKPSHGHSNHHH